MAAWTFLSLHHFDSARGSSSNDSRGKAKHIRQSKSVASQMELTILESSDALAVYTKGDFTFCTYTFHGADCNTNTKHTMWHAARERGAGSLTTIGHGIGYPNHYMFSLCHNILSCACNCQSGNMMPPLHDHFTFT